MNSKKICGKCVLPESPPDIFLNEEGVCNLCVEHERARERMRSEKILETDFIKILDKYKSKGEYDCLVMCSGGKDSTAALYFMKERYKKNPLAFTFNHGFETEEALDNIHRASDKLGVDFLYFKSDYMKEMFSAVVKEDASAVICHLCSIWYMRLTLGIARKFNIPIIVAGWTKGQSTKKALACEIGKTEFSSMADSTRDFLKKYTKENPKYRDFPLSMDEVLAKAGRGFKYIIVSPHWFLPYDAAEYTSIIEKEVGWKMPELSYPAESTNCELNFLSVYLSMKKHGYTHYHVEMSKLIREGLMTREDALEKLKINFSEEVLDEVAKKLNCKIEDVDLDV